MRKTLFTVAIIIMATVEVLSQNFDIKLNNGNRMNIEVCNDQIFRIKITQQKDFPESLMERYGILKTDWSEQTAIRKDDGNIVSISTAKYNLLIDTKSGTISAKDSTNKIIVESINFIPPTDKRVQTMGESLNKRFADFNKTGGIIGDDVSEEKKIANTEVGDFKNNSIIGFSLKEGERFYGGGNTSRKHIQHRGEILRMWTTYQHTEIPMPFIISSEGWAVFNNTTVRNYFDIGVSDKNKMWIYNTTKSADFYLLMGNSMTDAINLYTTVTGRSFILPKWAYGLAFGGNMLENLTEIMNDALRFRDEQIPCDMLWLEPQWMSKRYDFSTEKNWDYKKFPGEPYWEEKTFPKKEHQALFIGRLHGMGYKLALWLCIDFDQSLPEEDAIASAANKPQSGQEHWFDHLTKFMDEGVDGFKLDPARTLDEHPDRQYYNGLTDKDMHNLNQILMPKQMYQTFRNHTNRRPFHHYCGGWSGTQHWSASQSGDNGGGRTALFDQLNLSLSGYMNTSCDVMSGVEDEMAGLHMGVLLPWVQINSWFSLMHPWFFPPEKKATYKYYIQLRHALFPYIYSSALKCTQTGEPILKAMPLAFPDDRNVDDMVYQYMFGNDLLVGVFSDSIYLPKGNWINYWTGEEITGKQRTEKIAIPKNRGGHLFIREGAIIPYQKDMQYIGEHPLDTLIIKVYPKGETSYTLYEDDGLTFKYENGEIAKTRFDCNQTQKKTTFTIQPTEGYFEGIYKSRVYCLEMFTKDKPKKLKINGKETKEWIYENGKIEIVLDQPDTSKNLQLTIDN